MPRKFQKVIPAEPIAGTSSPLDVSGKGPVAHVARIDRRLGSRTAILRYALPANAQRRDGRQSISIILLAEQVVPRPFPFRLMTTAPS